MGGEYSFSIFDSYGDGLVLENPNSPNYVEAYDSLIFDGVEINTSKGIDATPKPTSAPTSAPVCEKDDSDYRYNGKKRYTCAALFGLSSDNKRSYCNKNDSLTGQPVSSYCCATCEGFVEN